MPSGQPVFNVWLKACRGVMKHILIFCRFCFWWAGLALLWKPKKKFEKSELKAIAWQMVLRHCLWFESAINKYMGPITCDANDNTYALAQLSQQNSEGNRQGQWNFCQGNKASGKNEKHQKTSSKQTSRGDCPKLGNHNHYYHYTQPNEKLPSLKSSFLWAKQQSAGCKWNLQPTTWFMLNNLSLWN